MNKIGTVLRHLKGFGGALGEACSSALDNPLIMLMVIAGLGALFYITVVDQGPPPAQMIIIGGGR